MTVEPSRGRVRAALAYSDRWYGHDPDAETAVLATEVRRLLDTDAKLERVRGLVRAWEQDRASLRHCQSVAELAECIEQRTKQLRSAATAPTEKVEIEDLVHATHHVAQLALQASCSCAQHELRACCARIAMRSETDAAHLRRQLLWNQLQGAPARG
jgi:hypothetical protein